MGNLEFGSTFKLVKKFVIRFIFSSLKDASLPLEGCGGGGSLWVPCGTFPGFSSGHSIISEWKTLVHNGQPRWY